jgi:hypothetical protein
MQSRSTVNSRQSTARGSPGPMDSQIAGWAGPNCRLWTVDCRPTGGRLPRSSPPCARGPKKMPGTREGCRAGRQSTGRQSTARGSPGPMEPADSGLGGAPTVTVDCRLSTDRWSPFLGPPHPARGAKDDARHKGGMQSRSTVNSRQSTARVPPDPWTRRDSGLGGAPTVDCGRSTVDDRWSPPRSSPPCAGPKDDARHKGWDAEQVDSQQSTVDSPGVPPDHGPADAGWAEPNCRLWTVDCRPTGGRLPRASPPCARAKDDARHKGGCRQVDSQQSTVDSPGFPRTHGPADSGLGGGPNVDCDCRLATDRWSPSSVLPTSAAILPPWTGQRSRAASSSARATPTT